MVIKYSGKLADIESTERIAKQALEVVHTIGARVVIVHGGGVQINEAIKAANIDAPMDVRTGLRITPKEALDILDDEMGKINRRTTAVFNRVANDLGFDGIRPFGMAGYDRQLVIANRAYLDSGNYTGIRPIINQAALSEMFSQNSAAIPIIYPVGWSNDEDKMERRANVNADDVAAALATALDAKLLLYLSDVEGVRLPKPEDIKPEVREFLDQNFGPDRIDIARNILTEIPVPFVDRLIEFGIVTGGMIPKVRTAAAVANELRDGATAILNGASETAVFDEMTTKTGSGTLFIKPKIKFG